MDAFITHEHVISDYKSYLQSFINIQDQRILEYVNEKTLLNNIIPEPLIQFNPSFQRGKSFADLVKEKVIDANLPKALDDYRLYRHQVEAIEIGVQKKGFVVTSGTGSGKSLTFLATIFNDIIKQADQKPKGVKAILVYPMNALINSQYEEIAKYHINYLESFVGKGIVAKEGKTLKEVIEQLESKTSERFPISYAQYTGQEGGDVRSSVKDEEPDIILTNYMMLELIMTRQSEKWLRNSMNHHLQFVVYDELHTYRGRQGSDVSILNRRIQSICQKELIFIGTSATMASKGNPLEKRQKVAEVASQIFGKSITSDYVINEYLEPCTLGKEVNPFQLAEAIKRGIPAAGSEEDFIQHDLANWLELHVALKDNNGVLERGKPLNITQIVSVIAEVTSLPQDQIKNEVIQLLKWAERINEENRKAQTRKSFLPFRFHQFISQTGSISVTLEPRSIRHIESTDEKYVKIGDVERKLYPLLFSRYTGYDFICVELDTEQETLQPLIPSKEFQNKKQEEVDKKNPAWDDFKYGYIVLDEGEEFWNTDFLELVPSEWWNKQETDLQPYYKMLMPTAIYFNADGQFSFEPKYPMKGYFIPSKLRIDPTASIIYEDSKTSDFTKLSRLGSEGRSTATSIISYGIVNSLVDQGESLQNQKLLSFTDNRQDASLQAGHFNDFYSTIRLRSALYHSIEENDRPYEIHEVAESIFKTLDLKESDYAVYPTDDPDFPDDKNIEALKHLLLYRTLQDLKRGWRYNLPNLEQVALLEIGYKNLEKLVGLHDRFKEIDFLNTANEKERYEFLKNILDYFRTNFALDHRFFKDNANIETLMRDRLNANSLWSLDYNEKIDKPTDMVINIPRPRPKGKYIISLGQRSNLGKYINRVRTKNGLDKLVKEDYQSYLVQILEVLKPVGIIAEADKKNAELVYYKLRADAVLWKKGNGETVAFDETRINVNDDAVVIKPNLYFQNLYKTDFKKYKKELIAREHTGQIGAQQRIEREDAFRKGEISTMYCSPTMELGIDIANLNIVHMRNVPPNAANYAQRSGRAGRGGQTALVFTYCSTMSPHDVNYFKNAAEMVAGTVQPPSIDLVNEELILSHLNAFVLMKLEVSELTTSAAEILDLSNEQDIKIKSDIYARIEHNVQSFSSGLVTEFQSVIRSIFTELNESNWFTEQWVNQQISTFPQRFSKAFDRWIRMFKNACIARDKAQAILDNHTFKSESDEKAIAKRQERFARNQIELLKNENKRNASNSEFYVYRYLAAEGFLPGYNFTRLPVRAVLGKPYKDDVEILSRPRSLALSEFGPANTIYHAGSKFKINRMQISELEEQTEKILISKQTGYAFFNEDIKTANIDPISSSTLRGDAIELYNHVVEFSECEGAPLQKITCIEEERSRSGYEILSYFNFPRGIENAQSVVLKKNGEKLLQLYFSKTANLIKVNKKARRAKEDGFKIDQRNGVWVQQRQLEKNKELADNTKEIMLYTKDTADVLYIQPLGNIGASPEQVITLSYALKRGIEKLFLVEESEIAVSTIGHTEKPNILIHEASEGSLGILSQLINEPLKMKEWFKAAYGVIHFDPETREETELGKTLPQATYQDLLSYYNQIHHRSLNRHDIKEVLEDLMDCEVELVQGKDKDREEQYQYLLNAYDENSSTEFKFLKYLYNNGYALPDIAQKNLEDYYISADFIYKNGGNPVIIFVDGSVHDQADVIAGDLNKRKILKDAGYDVIVWRYDEPLEELMARRKDIFRKVK